MSDGEEIYEDEKFEFIDMVERNLPVQLSSEVLIEKGQELAHLGVEIEQKKEARSDAAKAAKREIDELEARRSVLQNAVASGAEECPVECRREGCWDANAIRIIREDTGEIIERRAMEADERQEDMFNEEPEASEDKGSEPAEGDNVVDFPPEPGDEPPAE